MKTLKRILLSRKTVIILIVLLLITIVSAYVFPQRFLFTEVDIGLWKFRNPQFAYWYDLLGLDHVYSTPWFAALLFLFLISLTTTTFEQINISRKKTFGSRNPPSGERHGTTASSDEISGAMKKAGYFLVHNDSYLKRFVKNPWGYWGNVLLHLGIVITIASSLLIVSTRKRGLLHLVEGESYIPGAPWIVEENGVLAGNFVLPDRVILERVTPEFWETDDLKSLTTDLKFVDDRNRENRYTVGINKMMVYKNLHVYQAQSFGHAFFVRLNERESGSEIDVYFQIQHPLKRDKPSYDNFNVEGIPYMIKTKYFADADKASMDGINPLLVMRLVEGEDVISEVSLQVGQSVDFGPYAARLVHVSKWAGVIFVDIKGMSGIFLGFFIIIIGGMLTYFMPPRDIYVFSEGNGFSLAWKTTRFMSFYEDEFERIVSRIRSERTDE